MVALLFIDQGADVWAAGDGRSTPLHVAAQNGYEAVARLLIVSGAYVSAADKRKSAPMGAKIEPKEAIARAISRCSA